MKFLKSSYLFLRAEALCEVISAKRERPVWMVESALRLQTYNCTAFAVAAQRVWRLWSKNKEIGSLPLVKANLLHTDIGGMHMEWGWRKATSALARPADSTLENKGLIHITDRLPSHPGMANFTLHLRMSVRSFFSTTGSLFFNLFFFHIIFLLLCSLYCRCLQMHRA